MRSNRIFAMDSGLSLLEVMVSLAISLIIGAALFAFMSAIYRNQIISYKLNERIMKSEIMKAALDNTVANQGGINVTAGSSSSSDISSFLSNVSSAIVNPISVTSSQITAEWIANNQGNPVVCTGTLQIINSVMTYTISANAGNVSVCGVTGNTGNTVSTDFPVGSGWSFSANPADSCLSDSLSNAELPVIATKSAWGIGNPIEVSTCVYAPTKS